MCAKHGREHYARLSEQRRAAKARARARQNTLTSSLDASVLEEGPDMSEAEPEKRVKLSEDQKVEIIDAYTKTDESSGKLIERFGVKWSKLYAVLDQAGITWRRGNSISFETWQAQQQVKHVDEQQMARDDSLIGVVPEPVAKALENMIDTDHVLKPRPEPVAPTPAIERRVLARGPINQRWSVRVEGLVYVNAPDIAEALRLVQQDQPDMKILAINPAFD